MIKVNQPYTVGKWTTRIGSERAFITEWERFAKWTAKNQQGAGIGYLLQDKEKPQEFISFGPWENDDAIKAWRERPEFKTFVSTIGELCAKFQPQSLALVATSAQ